MAIEQLYMDGYVTPIPGAYSKKKTAGDAGPVIPKGVVCLFSASNFFRIKPLTPYVVTSKAALKEILPVWGARFNKTIFSPSQDPDIKGGPSLVYLVNAAPSTRATSTLTNAGGDAMKLSSRIWGLEANQIWYKLETGTTKGKKFTLGFVNQDTQVLDDIGGDNIFSLTYAGSHASAMAASVLPATGVTVTFTKGSAITAGHNYAPVGFPFHGVVTLENDVNNGATPANDMTFTVTGITTAGVATTEAIKILGDEGSHAGLTEWRSISSIALTSGAYAAASATDVLGTCFDLTIADGYDTIAKVLDAIDLYADFTVADEFGDSSTRLVSSMDRTAGTDVMSPAVGHFKADLDALWRAIGNDEIDEPTALTFPLIIAERCAGATGAPNNVTVATRLSGAVNGAASNADWENAFAATQSLRISEVWAETTDTSVWALLNDHLAYMHGEGGDERCVSYGTTTKPSKSALTTAVNAINREFGQLWVNDTQQYNEMGKKQWFPPLYAALRAACAYAGMATPAQSLTNKLLDVLDIREGSDWTFAVHGKEIQNKGVCLLAKDDARGGFYCVRDCTTYRKSDDVLLTQGSTVRVMRDSEKAMRTTLKRLVGQPGFVGTEDAVLQGALDELARQRDKEKILRGWASCTLTVNGTKWVVESERYPVEPILFAVSDVTFSRQTTFTIGG